MAIAQKIAYNVVIVSILKVASTVFLSLFSIKLITGYLGQDGFGRYATVLAFFAFFSAIADLGIGMISVREISRDQADEQRILGNVITLRLLSSFGVFLLAPILIFFFHYPLELKIGILIGAFAVIFSTLSLVLNGIFQKRVAMQEVAFIEFIGKILQVSFITYAVAKNLGFLSIVSAILISMSFNATAVFLASRRHIRFQLRFERSYWKEFLHESYPMGVTAMITFLYFKLDTILLSVLRPAADVGIYNVAYKIMENLIFFPAMLAGLIIPLLSRYLLSDRQKFDLIVSKTFKVFFLIAFPIVVGTLLLAKDIIFIVSGPDFLASATVLRILIFSLAFIFFGHFFNMILLVANAQRKLMRVLSIAAISNIVLNLALIPRFSYLGSATASTLTELFVVVAASFVAYRQIGYRPSMQGVFPIVGSGIGMAALIAVFHGKVSFPLLGFAAILSYVMLLWLFRGVTREEIGIILSGRKLSQQNVVDPSELSL